MEIHMSGFLKRIVGGNFELSVDKIKDTLAY